MCPSPLAHRQLGLPHLMDLVIREALMTICRIWHCIEEFLTAGFESVSGHGSVRVISLISIIHDKIIPQGERKIYPVVREKGRFLQQAGKLKERP